jgi:uncharacterized protein YggU (UPF0235/DUF167 family)
VRIQVHVSPKSRVDDVRASRADGTIRIRVTAAPEDGRANLAVLRLLSDRLEVPSSALRLAGGASSRRKWIEVEGVTEAELWRRLEARP